MCVVITSYCKSISGMMVSSVMHSERTPRYLCDSNYSISSIATGYDGIARNERIGDDDLTLTCRGC